MEREIATVASEEALFFARSGLQTKLIRKLKRGQFPIEAYLDLHQLTVAEAEQALIEFIFNCKQHNLRHVCIIHGKGMHSVDQIAKLKGAVNSWLRELDSILAFCSAQPKDGGAGAVYVLLKRQRRIEE